MTARDDMLRDVDPTMAAAIAPYLRLPEQFSDAASQDAQKLRPFPVVIGTKDRARLRLPVMARSSSEAQEQHECLALEGERVEVLPHANRAALRPELETLHPEPPLRQTLRARDLNLAEQFAGPAFPLKGTK